MSLVYSPIADRRQKPTFKANIPEKQAMVRYYNIASLSLLSGTMDKTASSKEGALVTQAFVALGPNAPTGNGAVINFQSVHIVVVALLHKRKQARQSRRLVDFLLTIMNYRWPLIDQAIHLAKARIVTEPFQRSVRDAESLRKKGQLLMHQLI